MNANQILVTGSSGLIGTALVRSLRRKRISTISLHRRSLRNLGAISAVPELLDPYGRPFISQPAERKREMRGELGGTTAAVHLAGANLSGQRWSSSYKKEILESRVKPTHALAVLLAGLKPKPSVLVCASAIGIYGGRGDEVLSESSQPGTGFLPEVCLAWEKATRPAKEAGIRVVHLRFGVVLSTRGGALAKMLPIFRAGLGGKLGGGDQWMSWVALSDVTRAIEFVLDTPSLSGPVNVVTPNPVTNSDFTLALGRALHRPTLVRVPTFALRMAFGEMADATILESERVVPTRLTGKGFHFAYPDIQTGLQAVLAES
jgi:uncharacterized protein